MGVVYEALQGHPLRRRVALKLIKRGMDTRKVVARFESERQALAMMEHPNIAKVFDAGSTEAGRPYFVMELVNGESITSYCDRHNLPMRARLELFLDVCHAVQHAHQKGIIHRDLKPSNILVTQSDGAPVPKPPSPRISTSVYRSICVPDCSRAAGGDIGFSDATSRRITSDVQASDSGEAIIACDRNPSAFAASAMRLRSSRSSRASPPQIRSMHASRSGPDG
jgi:serine/threonine protein kinase